MAGHAAQPKNEAHPFHLALLVVGGLCLGVGILDLYWSFGWQGGDLNSDFGLIGWTGLDDLALLPAANISIPLIVTGALCLIIANATAWRETGGY